MLNSRLQVDRLRNGKTLTVFLNVLLRGNLVKSRSKQLKPGWKDCLKSVEATSWKTFGIWTNQGVSCALPDRCLSEKGRRCKGSKHSKVRMTVAFIVSATGGKVIEPTVIWKSKIPRCFRYLEDKSRPANLHYFSNEKSWMNTDIMVKILSMVDAKRKSQNRNVILFIDNAPCHPTDLKDKFSNINVRFLPKNTTSRLKPLDPGIIQSFKVKYRKLLLKFVISRVNDKETTSEIVKEVDVKSYQMGQRSVESGGRRNN